MNTTTSDESTLKISLIDTKIRQKQHQSFCQRYFVDCLTHLFFRKRDKSAKDEMKNSFSKSYDERPSSAIDYLEINIEDHKKSKSNPKNFFSKYKVENFPQNELFLLEGSLTHKPILVKISEKHFPKTNRSSDDLNEVTNTGLASFFSTLSQSDKFSKQLKKLPLCFPQYAEKIKYNVDYLNESDFPDENFSEYIASKIQGNLIVDLTGGVGEYSIPIAKKSNFVISCSNNLVLANFLKENSELYKSKNMEFVIYPDEKTENFQEFLTMKNKNNKADVIILNPMTIIRNFSSKKIYNEYFKKLLKLLSKNSKNFVLILPKHFQNFEGLADLLAESLKKNERCGVEIEKIFKNNKLKHLVIYYGSISIIKGSEEMAFIHNLVESFEEKQNPSQDSLKNNFRCISNQISYSHGNMALLEIISNAIKDYPKERSLNVYSYIINVFRKNTVNFICSDTNKICHHDLTMVKSLSSNFENLKLKSALLMKKNSASNEEITETLKLNKKSDISLDKLENHNKLVAIESFASEPNDIVSDYSKSFQGNLELEETEGEKKSFIVDVKRMKRSESGAHNTMESLDKYQIGTFFNSLNEKNII